MSSLTFDQIIATPVGEIATLDSAMLFELRMQVSEFLNAAKAVNEQIEKALELKYAEHAQKLRLAAGKDTGVTHFDDGRVRVTADLPKRVEWDQTKLSDIVQRIVDAGDDPSQYVEINFRVSETKYNAWPQVLRDQFAAARTLKTGKPSFRLALLDAGGAQ
jgi:hypothetical protein